MIRLIQGCTIIALLLCIGSCSRHQTLRSSTPATASHQGQKSDKQKIATTNWQKVATALADSINTTLILKDYADKSVYLHLEERTSTQFDRSFKELLTASLLEKGVPVVSRPGLNSLTLTCNSQLLLTSKSGFWSRSRRGTLLLTAHIIFEKRYIFSRSELFSLEDNELPFFSAPTPGETITITKKREPNVPMRRTIILEHSQTLPANPKPIL